MAINELADAADVESHLWILDGEILIQLATPGL